jgi:hypothetical protein
MTEHRETIERVTAILQGERLCVRCHWYKRGLDGYHSDICQHPKAAHQEPGEDNGVRSAAIMSQYGCFAMRSGICGEKAALFELKG